MSVRIILVRHGKVQGQGEGRNERLLGYTNAPLSPEGVAEIKRDAELIAKVLRVKRIYHSGLARTKEAAQIIAKTSGIGEIREDRRLRSADRGALVGRRIVDVQGTLNFLHTHPMFKFPKGGSMNEFWDRVEGVAKDLARLDGDIVVICHGSVIAAFPILLNGEDRSKIPQRVNVEGVGSVGVVERQNGKWVRHELESGNKEDDG